MGTKFFGSFGPSIFLLILSIFNLLSSLKHSIVIDNYVRKNSNIVEKVNMYEFTGLRVRSGIWKYITMDNLVLSYYIIIIIAILIILIFFIDP